MVTSVESEVGGRPMTAKQQAAIFTDSAAMPTRLKGSRYLSREAKKGSLPGIAPPSQEPAEGPQEELGEERVQDRQGACAGLIWPRIMPPGHTYSRQSR